MFYQEEIKEEIVIIDAKADQEAINLLSGGQDVVLNHANHLQVQINKQVTKDVKERIEIY